MNCADQIKAALEADMEMHRLRASRAELLAACEMQNRLIKDILPSIGQMALPDYALLNEALIMARAAIANAKAAP